MKKVNKVLRIFFAVTFLVSCVLFNHLNAFSETPKNKYSHNIEDSAKSLIDFNNIDLAIESVIPLYDYEETIIGWACELAPTGYIIMDNNYNAIEFSFSSNIPFDKKSKVYFTGPFNYYFRYNDNFIHYKNNSKISEFTMKQQFNDYKNKVNNNTQIINTSTYGEPLPNNPQYNLNSNTHYTIPGTLRTYDFNPNGICGSTAAAIMLMYYRDYVDSWMVPSWHATSNGISLIELLVPNIDGEQPGSTCNDVKNGLNWYFRWRGISDEYNATSIYLPLFASYQSVIRNHRPVEILIANHYTYNNHWIVGYGFSIQPSGGNPYYAIVNNGWGSNHVYISWTFVDSIVYLNE